MSRLVFLIIFLMLAIGGLVVLSTLAKEVPTTTIEADVGPATDAR